MTGSGDGRPVQRKRRVLGASVLLLVGIALGVSQAAEAQKAPACNLVPQLRDLTVNQGVGAYSPLVNGKETLVRFYLSMPSCASSSSLIQIKEGSTLTVTGGTGGIVANPTPVPVSSAYPPVASYSVAPMADSTGDPKFVVPPSFVTSANGFTATFSAKIKYQSRPNARTAFTQGEITFSNRPGTNTPISAAFAGPTNAFSALFVPMGDASRSYSSQWSSTAQQALQDGMTSALARQYPLPAGVGQIGGTGGLRYSVTPTLLDLRALNVLDANGKFCGTGSSYDLIKAQLAQFRLSHDTANPNAKANRVVGVVDPSTVGLGPPDPCFEGMSVVGSQEAWALALPNKTGQLVGLELAHTLGLTPPNRESPFDGAHSQNQTAENPSLNRRFNLVERAFVPTDRSLLKPSATNPSSDNVNTLLETPDYSFLLCVFGGPVTSECSTYGPGTVSATAPVASTLAFVMSGTTTGQSGLTCGPSVVCVGTATGTTVVESYFASGVPLTSESPASDYRLVQRDANGNVILPTRGVPVGFRHSEHGAPASGPRPGLFAFALPLETQGERIELWKGAPDASGSLLLYAQNRTGAPTVSSMTVGSGPILLSPQNALQAKSATAAPQVVETLRAEANTPTTPTTITPTTPLSTSVTYGNSFASASTLCANWFFTGDLFDPGETIFVKWGPIGAGGIQNTGSTSRRTQLQCFSQTEANLLLDGTEPIILSVEGGSVTVGGFVVSLTGDSTAPVGYRISSDSSTYTLQQGGSVPVTTTVTDDPDAASPPGVELFARNLVPSGGFSTSPSGGVPSFTSNGTLSAPASTPTGDYHLIVTGVGGGFTRTSMATVTVTAGGAQPGPTYTVNVNTDPVTPVDAGCTTTECTLGEAIAAANEASTVDDTIAFDIGGDTEIALDNPLPAITDTVLIDGLSQPEGQIVINGNGAGAEVDGLTLATGSSNSEIRGLEIRDFLSGAGVYVTSASNKISSNTIHSVNDGVRVAGTGATGNVIGANVGPGDLALINDALGNVLVSAGSDGIEIEGSASGTIVAGNYIGTDRAAATTRGNGATGIRIVGASNNQIGPGNKIAHNGTVATGVRIVSGSGNRIVANSIHDNLGKGISIFEGANGDLREPTLTSASFSGSSTTVSGTIGGMGVSDGSYFAEFFKNAACDTPVGSGEGETYLDFATVTASGGTGSFSKSLSGLALGDVVTATLTRAATPFDTSEFSNCVTVSNAPTPGREPVFVESSDDNPAYNTLDLYLDCGPGKPKQVIAVGLKPNSVGTTSASWSTNYDSTLAPADCDLLAVVMDGFSRSGFTVTGTKTVSDGPNALVAAISSVRQGATILQYGVIPLRGSIRNAEGERPSGELAWTVTGPGGLTFTRTGPIVDLQPPNPGGWPAGSYTATLTKPGSTEPSATDDVTFTVLADGDNDGIPKSVDEGCLGGGDDDPLNFDDDKDSDGIPNANDPQPCTPATSYTAIVGLNPDPLPTGSSGSPITAEVRVPGRNMAQVLASSVRITRVADDDILVTDSRFANTAWTINNGVGIAKFDRQKIVAYLTQRNLRNRIVTITVGGRSGAPPWSFEGSDTVFVQP